MKISYPILSTLLISLSLSLLLSSCSKDCNHEAEGQQEIWDVKTPEHYSYEYRISCFCSADDLGPFYVEMKNGMIDTAYTLADDEFLSEMINDYSYVKSIVEVYTIDAMFDRFQSENFNSLESECTIEYDENYGYPHLYKNPGPDDIADAGFLWELTNFQVLE